MYVTQTMDGFNPLKAIGRAFGGTGRALISAIPIVGGAASNILDTAARAPSGASTVVTPSAQPINIAPGGAVTTTGGAPYVPPPAAPASSTDDFMKQLLLMSAMQNQQSQPAPSATPPVFIPTGGGGGGGPVYIPQPQAGGGSQLPSWLPMAALGAIALLFLKGK